MKQLTILNALVFISLIICSGTVAGELSYTCTVKHVYNITDTGSLRSSSWENQFKGKQFSVSRTNGEIIGEVIPTLMAKSKKVVNPGNEGFSFKAVAYFENQVQAIEVKEFKAGKEKPFVALSMGGAGIVTGTCK